MQRDMIETYPDVDHILFRDNGRVLRQLLLSSLPLLQGAESLSRLFSPDFISSHSLPSLLLFLIRPSSLPTPPSLQPSVSTGANP